MNWDECLFVFVMMTYVRSRGPLPPGEGARSAGEGKPRSVSHPHPAFGHPLPEGEGSCPSHTSYKFSPIPLQPHGPIDRAYNSVCPQSAS